MDKDGKEEVVGGGNENGRRNEDEINKEERGKKWDDVLRIGALKLISRCEEGGE